MNSCCDNAKNPLLRDGYSQLQRQPLALSPMSVQIDERQMAEMLTFIYRFARQLNYYDDHNNVVKNKNWQGFFENDVIIQIAIISKTNPLRNKESFYILLKLLAAEEEKDTYTKIFDILFSLTTEILDWYKKLQFSPPISYQVNHLIKTGLVASVQEALTLAEKVQQESGTGFLVKDEWRQLPKAIDMMFLLPSAASSTAALGTPEEVAENLDNLFQVIYKVYTQIIGLAPAYLAKEVNGDQQTKAHLALLVTFIRLMEHTREDINLLPKKHLDFYYKSILQLKEKPAVPDKVHLVFEIAKHLADHMLPAGTLVKAGKDNKGVEQQYKLEQELVINKAQITSFKTIYVNFTMVKQPASEVKYFNGIHVAPIANSGDGKGGEFPDKNLPGWPALGSIEMPGFDAGFAIASKLLLLQEGIRSITFNIHYKNNSTSFPLKDEYLAEAFNIHLSGVKDWLRIENLSGHATDDLITITVTLDASQPAVTWFNPDKLGNLDTTLPVARITVNFNKQLTVVDAVTSQQINVSAYHFLKEVSVTGIDLEVTARGLKNLVLQNDLSILDANKAFLPFGPVPQAGGSFYVGSAEIFQKELSKLTLTFKWQDLPTNFASYYEGYYLQNKLPLLKDAVVSIEALNDKIWNEISSGKKLFVNDGKDVIEPGITIEVPAATLKGTDAINDVIELNNSSLNGFIRLVLKSVSSTDNTLYLKPFLNDDYVKAVARQAMAVAKYPVGLPGALYKNASGIIVEYKVGDTGAAPGEVVMPNLPYTPVIKEISADYTAVAGPDKIEFFHLHPFEGFEQIPVPAAGTNVVVPTKKVSLLPQFDDEGSLLIEISGLNPPENLSILFQVIESSANTDLLKAVVRWYYMVNNQWVPFEDYQVLSDTTDGLIASGITSFEIPEQITSANTVLPAGMFWLKAAVAERTGAVCEILKAFTQAGSVVFVDNGNNPGHYLAPLPAGSISKLVENDSGVKTITQPYDSFGARPPEQPVDFYTRTSERLRHKGRAITIFDYERIVLERFNEIYKVRCINHTDDTRELSPGFVTLAVVPELKNKSLVDRLSPKVNINLLTDIEGYVRSVTSPHVTIKVLNPKYEQVKVAFQVKFYPGKSTGFYKRLLNESIMKFLSPWAFLVEGAAINFGGKIYKSSILDFVEKQDYVDYVLDFKMMHIGPVGASETNVDEITASFARTILTSVEEHTIEPITADMPCIVNKPVSKVGYGYMTLLQDFEILTKGEDQNN